MSMWGASSVHLGYASAVATNGKEQAQITLTAVVLRIPAM